MTAAIVLAAGESSRLGRPKQDVVLNGETLLQRSVRVAIEAQLAPVWVVVRESRYITSDATPQGELLLNSHAQEGMASSIRVGVEAARAAGVRGVVVMTCDQPGVTAAHLQSLILDPDRMCGSEYADRIGVPAYFPRASFEDLLSLKGDSGARGLLVGAQSVALRSLAVDIDTEEDFRTAQVLFER